MDEKLLSTLESMKGKTFQYANQAHYITSYILDEEQEKCTIKTNLSTFDRRFENMETFLQYWKPVDKDLTLYNEPELWKNFSNFIEQENDRSKRLINTLEDNITKVQQNKDYIPQAEAINKTVTTIIGIEKVRLSMLKMMIK
jgi:hypothetical protein